MVFYTGRGIKIGVIISGMQITFDLKALCSPFQVNGLRQTES